MGNSRKRGPADLSAGARRFLQAHVSPGARLCLGLSGGLDSTVLLHLLSTLRAELGFRLDAAHVHHGLSANADAWASHCEAVCAALDVPLRVERVSVEPAGDGLEAAARRARHAVYARQEADFIVLGHHLDDQVETFFLRLLRGAGLDGLAGMRPLRALAEGKTLLRPLLDVTRSELEAYAAQHRLAHVEDESNRDQRLTRNWLRHGLLPTLAGRYPAYRQVIGRAIGHLGESQDLLDDLARLDLERAGSAESLAVEALRGLSPARRRNLLRYWLARSVGLVPSAAQLEQLDEQMCASAQEASPVWRLGGHCVRRHRDTLSLHPWREGEVGPDEWAWHGEEVLDLGGAGLLRFERVSGQGIAAARLEGQRLVIRRRQGGEAFRPDCRRPRRALKKLLREDAVPAWERADLPLLFVGGELVWVAGVGIDCAYQASAGEAGWLISWRSARPARSDPGA